MVLCSCACSISRSIVKVVNCLFLLISLGIIGFGGYLFTTDAMDWIGNGLAIGLVCFGVFVFLLSGFGLCSAKDRADTVCIGDSKCCMGIYTSFLLILILAQIAAVIVMIVWESDAEQFLQDRWNDMSFEQQVDIMEEFKCGPYSPTFGEHFGSDMFDEDKVPDDIEAYYGKPMVDGLLLLVRPYFNSDDPTTICKVDEVIEDIGQDEFNKAIGFVPDVTEDINDEPTDICFQDCYGNFKDEFLTLGNIYIIVLISFACMEIFLLTAACCALFSDDDKVYDSNGNAIGNRVGTHV